MKRTVLAVLGAISLSACAQSPSGRADTTAAATTAASAPATSNEAASALANTPDARAIEAIRRLNPQVEVERVAASPMSGFREAIVGGQVVYVSDDGRYVFVPGSGGALFDATVQKNLTEDALSGLRREMLAKVPKADRIVFAPANPVHTVTVFTDVACGYCRRMHSEVAEYNQQGIAIEYLAFPRMGLASEDYKTMVSVWCASDRRKALTDAKAGKAVPNRSCRTPVDQQYDIGQRVGLTGTPMIIAADGSQLGGYVPAAQLRALLDQRAAPAESQPDAAVERPAG